MVASDEMLPAVASDASARLDAYREHLRSHSADILAEIEDIAA
jgi:hypothetical protein